MRFIDDKYYNLNILCNYIPLSIFFIKIIKYAYRVGGPTVRTFSDTKSGDLLERLAMWSNLFYIQYNCKFYTHVNNNIYV